MDYESVIAGKSRRMRESGREISDMNINPLLFPFQRAMVRWAVRRGRAALWADTGLGKTWMQLEWARLIGGRCLILAPLAVCGQTIFEAKRLGIAVVYARTPGDIGQISITNYERLDAFDAEHFDSIVLDESGILKALDGKTRTKLIERFSATAHRLCCTATPAPNDFMELGNHAQFLGIMTWQEMAATYFVHDADAPGASGWRLKGHAQDAFWRWLVTWGCFMRSPADIGLPQPGYDLPPLEIIDETVVTNQRANGALFFTGLSGIGGRVEMRKKTMAERVARAAEVVAREPDQSWIVWCGMNDEGTELAKQIEGAVVVQGNDDPEEKAARLLQFARGEFLVLITKVKIAGYGLNFQNCARQVFLGLGDSYEQYYQAIRRSWRFGQIGLSRSSWSCPTLKARSSRTSGAKKRTRTEWAARWWHA